jgi:hypothetical protein
MLLRAYFPVARALETLHAPLSWIYLYDVTVTHYGLWSGLAIIPWSLPVTVVVGGAVATVVQVIFPSLAVY